MPDFFCWLLQGISLDVYPDPNVGPRNGKSRKKKHTLFENVEIYGTSSYNPQEPLVGGWTNRIEKIKSNWIISPGRDEHKDCFKPPPRNWCQQNPWLTFHWCVHEEILVLPYAKSQLQPGSIIPYSKEFKVLVLKWKQLIVSTTGPGWHPNTKGIWTPPKIYLKHKNLRYLDA